MYWLVSIGSCQQFHHPPRIYLESTIVGHPFISRWLVLLIEEADEFMEASDSNLVNLVDAIPASLPYVRFPEILSWCNCQIALVGTVYAFRFFLLPALSCGLVSEENGLAKLGSGFPRQIGGGNQRDQYSVLQEFL